MFCISFSKHWRQSKTSLSVFPSIHITNGDLWYHWSNVSLFPYQCVGLCCYTSTSEYFPWCVSKVGNWGSRCQWDWDILSGSLPSNVGSFLEFLGKYSGSLLPAQDMLWGVVPQELLFRQKGWQGVIFLIHNIHPLPRNFLKCLTLRPLTEAELYVLKCLCWFC